MRDYSDDEEETTNNYTVGAMTGTFAYETMQGSLHKWARLRRKMIRTTGI